MTKENGKWKIVRVSVPSISYLIDKGYGFGTFDEQKAKNIEETMDKKGLVLDNQGVIIKNIAASQEELAKERQGQVREITLNSGATTIQDVISTVLDEHTRPDSVLVYFTKSQNRTAWGGVVREEVLLWDYCRDVLPNEWYASWYSTAPTSVRAGALVVKMYGWYHTYHPKRWKGPLFLLRAKPVIL